LFFPATRSFAPVPLSADRFSEFARALFRLDPTPLMAAVAGHAVSVAIGEPIKAWRAILGITRPAALRDLKEAERHRCADPWRDGVPIYPKPHEIVERDREPAVFIATVRGRFDLDAIKHAPSRQTQRAPGGRFDHLDETARKLPAE
jgi:hypothetical protein